MKEFKVSYEDKEGDLSHVRVSAYDEEGAKSQANREYWDIERIIQVTPV
jgi:hypothetical protein